jgi:N-acetylmuramoyl-L-alanine amidase CwlA
MSIYNTDLVVVNKYSRPAYKLLSVKGIVIHWTANPGGTDTGHKTFFDGSDGGGGRYAGCHFFVDKDSATLIIPLDEVAYHANDMACRIPKLKATASFYKNGNANLTTIGIEMCVEKDGTIHPDTISRTVQLTSHLCSFYKLKTDDIYRHYDVTGKNCPAPWVANGQLFVDFKNRVNANLNAAIIYQAHVENIGWQSEVRNGETAGTTGQALRLEGLMVRLENSNAHLEIEGHIENKGWIGVKANSELVGTVGEGLRLEAIKINANGLNIEYRVHSESYGWMDWKKNGEIAGTVGEAKRIEAIEIKLV